jgi:hypothetical protein
MNRRTFLKSASIGSLVGAPWNWVFLEEYVSTYRDPACVHRICEKCRSAVTIEVEHDRADKEVSKRIGCPMLHLWEAVRLILLIDCRPRSRTRSGGQDFAVRLSRGDFHLWSPEKTAGMRLLEIGGLKARLLLGNSRSRALFRHHIAPRIAAPLQPG